MKRTTTAEAAAPDSACPFNMPTGAPAASGVVVDEKKDGTQMMNAIGSKVWFKGDEVTITSEPFMLHGGEFQNAIKADGSVVTIATAKQSKTNAATAQKAYADQQADFRRLR